jgi:GNAT superfamily N-acetyltransferase
VISERDSVLGYYQAAPVGAAFFLNYIAVAEGTRRMGLGGRLHSDFESWGVNFGFESAALDVFTSNRGVPDWYFRRGYKLLEKRYHARIDLSAVAPGRKKIVGRAEDWARALADEQRQGFARLTVRVGESNVELGLIDGCAVKALSWFDLTLEDCVGAIASSLAGERSELIVSGLEPCPVGLPYLAVEPALRLTRELRGDRQ